VANHGAIRSLCHFFLFWWESGRHLVAVALPRRHPQLLNGYFSFFFMCAGILSLLQYLGVSGDNTCHLGDRFTKTGASNHLFLLLY